MGITQQSLKTRVESRMIRHRKSLNELSSLKEFGEICEDNQITLVDLCNSMTSQIFSAAEIELNNSKVFEMLDRFLEAVAKELSIHPSDAVLLLNKLTSDMMVQIVTLIEMQEEEKANNESEEN